MFKYLKLLYIVIVWVMKRRHIRASPWMNRITPEMSKTLKKKDRSGRIMWLIQFLLASLKLWPTPIWSRLFSRHPVGLSFHSCVESNMCPPPSLLIQRAHPALPWGNFPLKQGVFMCVLVSVPPRWATCNICNRIGYNSNTNWYHAVITGYMFCHILAWKIQ